LGFDGDGGPALQAQLNYPCDLTVDDSGRIWIADSGNHRIRRLSPRATVVPPAPVEKLTVLHAASLRETAIAPGQIVSILGRGLGSDVRFDGRPAKVTLAGDERVDAQAPFTIAGRASTLVEVRRDGVLRGAAEVPVTNAAPALYTTGGGTGQAVALNQDGSLNSAVNPALKGTYIVLYATGQGDLQAGQSVSLAVGGHVAEVAYAGEPPDMPGVMQINARLPGAFGPGGILEVVLTVGAASSPQGVTIAVK
jgi:uncharacterized protein (TIGR03437 family)